VCTGAFHLITSTWSCGPLKTTMEGESSPSNVPASPQKGSTLECSGVLSRLAEHATKRPPGRSTPGTHWSARVGLRSDRACAEPRRHRSSSRRRGVVCHQPEQPDGDRTSIVGEMSSRTPSCRGPAKVGSRHRGRHQHRGPGWPPPERSALTRGDAHRRGPIWHSARTALGRCRNRG
jgi:hypothetical protein